MSKVISKAALGSLLNGRYRVVEILSVKEQVNTYLAEDIYQTDNPKCFVKQIELINNEVEWLAAARRRFANVVQTLKKLGIHPQIPELIGFFEENQSFYVVHEWIEGKPLSAELVPGQPWNEERVVLLLQEVLSILEFIRRHGFIHGKISPETIIRRASDGKLVLIDFGCESEICSQVERVENCNDSTVDIYALGIIALAALTGLNPVQLTADIDIENWREWVPVPVSNQLASVINQMLHVNFKKPSFAAAPSAEVDDNLPVAIRVTTRENNCLPEIESGEHQTDNPTSLTAKPSSRRSKLSISRLLVTGGLGLGVTANAGAMIFGLTTLLEASQIDPGQDIFTKASEEYKSGDFKQALALAKSIPTYSAVYYEARNAMRVWENEWNQASYQFQQVEKAFKENRWLDVFRVAEKIPDNSYWQNKLKPLLEKAAPKVKPEVEKLLQAADREVSRGDFAAGLKVLAKIPKGVPDYAQVQATITDYKQRQSLKLEAKAQQLLKMANAKAARKDFSGAVKLIRRIPKGTSVYNLAQARLIEYSQQRRIKADGLLQQANQKAAAGDFVGAIELLKRIPKGTSAYLTAQSKLLEYTNQRQIQKRRNTPYYTPVNRGISPSRLPQQRASGDVEGGYLVSQSLNPGDFLQEIVSIPFNLPG